MYKGDFSAGSIVDLLFTSVGGSVPATIGGTPVISIYKDNALAQATAGVTLGVDHDGITGLNHVRIDTSADGTFYSAGSTFHVVLTTGTVGGVSWVGYVFGSFSLRARSLEVAIARLPASLVSGRIDASVGAMAANTLTASALALDAVTEVQSGLAGASDLTAVKAKTDQLTFTLTGKVDASIQAADDFAQAAADKVWSSAARTLTSFGALVADVATAVWAAASRTLTSIDLSSLGGVTVELVSPVAQSGTLTIKQGDDYSALDARSVDFQYTGTYDPSTPTSITLKIYNFANNIASWTGTVVGSASPWTLRFQPTASQTAALAAGGSYRYDIEVVKNGRKVTISEGTCIVKVN